MGVYSMGERRVTDEQIARVIAGRMCRDGSFSGDALDRMITREIEAYVAEVSERHVSEMEALYDRRASDAEFQAFYGTRDAEIHSGWRLQSFQFMDLARAAVRRNLAP